jgi:hypothetical protein
MCPVAKDEALLEGGGTTSNTSEFHLHTTVEHFGMVMLTDSWRKVLQDTSGFWIEE